MRKGFIFSLDAAIALAIVIIAIGALAQQQSALDSGADIPGELHKKALDRAVTGFYGGQTSSETLEGIAPDFGECAAVYSMNIGNGHAEKWSFCETA